MTTVIKQAAYSNSLDSVQGTFKPESYENLTITATESIASEVSEGIVLISANVYFRLEFNIAATSSSMLLPPGVSSIIVSEGDILHLISDGVNGSCSIIIPEKA